MKKLRFLALPIFCSALLMPNLSKAQKQYLWDNKPATDWMTEAYPIGNGRIGAMIFGGTAQEHIQFNENSLWTGDEHDTGEYQAFGDLFLTFENINANLVKSYSRKLVLDSAVHNINFNLQNQAYQRTYLASNVDEVIALNYTAKHKQGLSLTVQLKDAHGQAIKAVNGDLVFEGKLGNGMQYAARVRAKIDGGTVTVGTDANGNAILQIKNANVLTLLLSAATDYANTRSTNWKAAVLPLEKNKRILDAAAKHSFASLKQRHYNDYSKLYNKLSIKLGTETLDPKKTTKELLIDFKKKPSTAMETLVYQYGRYLLLSSSRKGNLPANLQGLWNNSNTPPWRSDYHSNINVQMNYWPAEVANLENSAWPYLDYINSMREVKKENTQKEFPGVRGWTVRTENNIFGGESFHWNTPGSAWYAQAVWEHYAFNKDKAYLRDFAYPILKEITEFWDDRLVRRPDGTVVAPMGWSPEHGPTEDAVSYDHQIIHDLFTNYTASAEILGIDEQYKNHILDLRERLLKPQIGKWGQLQEWETDRDDPNDTHRHVSHLFGLYPGSQFSVLETPALIDAAKVTLTARGDESTGWSMAWKIAFWARLQDGQHAYLILKNFINLVGGSADGIDYNNGGGVYSNLLCAHPPFQIDGNLGYVAAVSEMLLQSQTGVLEILPAIPKEWATGSIQGLRARGNITITDLVWKDNKITKLQLSSPIAQTVEVLSPTKVANLKPTQIINGKYLYTIKLTANKAVNVIN